MPPTCRYCRSKVTACSRQQKKFCLFVEGTLSPDWIQHLLKQARKLTAFKLQASKVKRRQTFKSGERILRTWRFSRGWFFSFLRPIQVRYFYNVRNIKRRTKAFFICFEDDGLSRRYRCRHRLGMIPHWRPSRHDTSVTGKRYCRAGKELGRPGFWGAITVFEIGIVVLRPNLNHRPFLFPFHAFLDNPQCSNFKRRFSPSTFQRFSTRQ